jgi:hypothetical protein
MKHMNLQKLKDSEAAFLHRYPGGFENQELRDDFGSAEKPQIGKMVIDDCLPDLFSPSAGCLYQAHNSQRCDCIL